MGSFAGHIDEAIFFLAIAGWWMINAFPRHIISVLERREYQSHLSYKFPSRRNVPIEAILKTLFPICGFIAELWSRGPAFTDQDGNWRKLEEVQHMSIYALFTLHGIIDIMTSYNCPLPYGLDYLSGAVAFGWYGMSFLFHAQMPGKGDLEHMVHVLPVPIMIGVAVCMLLELHSKHRSFLVHLSRTYFLLVLGTFFTQVSFVLFRHDVFPGWQRNPAWDQDDHRNVHFIVAAFGFHLCLHVLTVTFTYCAIYAVLRYCCARGRHGTSFRDEPQKPSAKVSNDHCQGEEEYHMLLES